MKSTSASKAVHGHAILTVVWVLLIYPTVVYWKDSILWVSFMSLYAIVATHITGWQNGRTERKVDEQ